MTGLKAVLAEGRRTQADPGGLAIHPKLISKPEAQSEISGPHSEKQYSFSWNEKLPFQISDSRLSRSTLENQKYRIKFV